LAPKNNGNRPHGAAGYNARSSNQDPGLPGNVGIKSHSRSNLMSNQRHAYHWFGCILVSDEAYQSDPKHNVIAIDDATFRRIWDHMRNDDLPLGVGCEQIGFEQAPYEQGSVEHPNCECMFIAVGHTFTEGWQWYGTTVPHIETTDLELRNARFADAMRRAYDISLPEPLPMIGVASEH
jgi:hypothetical protein